MKKKCKVQYKYTVKSSIFNSKLFPYLHTIFIIRSIRFNEIHGLYCFRNLKIFENYCFIFIPFLRAHRSSSIHFNFVDPRRSTSRITEIEINPELDVRVVSPICALCPRNLRGKKIYSNVCKLYAQSSEMQIFIVEWICNPTALIMLSRTRSLLELNISSKMVVGKYISPLTIIRDSFSRINKKLSFRIYEFYSHVRKKAYFNLTTIAYGKIFTLHIIMKQWWQNNCDDFEIIRKISHVSPSAWSSKNPMLSWMLR